MNTESSSWIRPALQSMPEANPLMARHLEAYIQMLLEANKGVNLVSRRDTQSHVARFIRESLFLAQRLRREPNVEPQLLDLGSGAGFPGLVLKLALPDMEVVLVEATQKKARFLAQVCQQLDLNGMTVIWARAEALMDRRSKVYRPDLRHRFDWVTAKALGPLRDTLDLAAPFLAEGGIHWSFKGSVYQEELAACRRRMLQLGCIALQVEAIPEDTASYLVPIQRRGADVSRETSPAG